MITGYITRGTTIHGKSVDAGQRVVVDEDTFRLLSLGKDIALEPPTAPAPAPQPASAPESTNHDPAPPLVKAKPSKKDKSHDQ